MRSEELVMECGVWNSVWFAENDFLKVFWSLTVLIL